MLLGFIEAAGHTAASSPSGAPQPPVARLLPRKNFTNLTRIFMLIYKWDPEENHPLSLR